MASFTIITSEEVGKQVEKVFQSKILMENKGIKLRGINYTKGMFSTYASICIESKEENQTIQPSDVFFLGLYAGDSK